MFKTSLIKLGEKVIELFSKKNYSDYEIETKKIDVFSKAIILIFTGVFFMCVLASIFPRLCVTSWWFDVFDRIMNYILTNN